MKMSRYRVCAVFVWVSVFLRIGDFFVFCENYFFAIMTDFFLFLEVNFCMFSEGPLQFLECFLSNLVRAK